MTSPTVILLTCPFVSLTRLIPQSVGTIFNSLCIPYYFNSFKCYFFYLNESAHFSAGKCSLYLWRPSLQVILSVQPPGLPKPVLSALATLGPYFYHHMKLEISLLDCEILKVGAVSSSFWNFCLRPWLFYRGEPWVREVQQPAQGHTAS